MLPCWFDDEPWKFLVKDVNDTNSMFVKFKVDLLNKSYDIYMTDFAFIWHEHAEESQIQDKLKVALLILLQ